MRNLALGEGRNHRGNCMPVVSFQRRQRPKRGPPPTMLSLMQRRTLPLLRGKRLSFEPLTRQRGQMAACRSTPICRLRNRRQSVWNAEATLGWPQYLTPPSLRVSPSNVSQPPKRSVTTKTIRATTPASSMAARGSPKFKVHPRPNLRGTSSAGSSRLI